MVMSRILCVAFFCLFPLAASSGEVVLIANPSVAAVSLSRTNLFNIFLGPPAVWPDGIPVVPVDFSGSAALKDEFYQRFLERSLAQVRTVRARLIFSGSGFPPREVDSVAEMLQRVATTPGAIGYVPREQVNRSVREIGFVP